MNTDGYGLKTNKGPMFWIHEWSEGVRPAPRRLAELRKRDEEKYRRAMQAGFDLSGGLVQVRLNASLCKLKNYI